MKLFVRGGMVFALLISSIGRISAAEFTLTSTTNCDIRLTGDILPDDAKKLKGLLEQREWDQVPVPEGRFFTHEEMGRAITICLQSKGNNFAAGLKIIDAIFEYTNRGGKAIVWHGWADQLIGAEGTLDYYTRVQQQMGGPTPTPLMRRFWQYVFGTA